MLFNNALKKNCTPVRERKSFKSLMVGAYVSDVVSSMHGNNDVTKPSNANLHGSPKDIMYFSKICNNLGFTLSNSSKKKQIKKHRKKKHNKISDNYSYLQKKCFGNKKG